MSEGPQRPGEGSEDETRSRGLPDDAPAAQVPGDDGSTGPEAPETGDAAPDPAPGAEAGARAGADGGGDDSGATADAALPEPPPPAVVVRRGGGRAIAVVALVLVLILIGAMGGAVGWLVYRGEDPLEYVPIPTIEDFRERIASLEGELADARRSSRRALDREADLREQMEELSRSFTALSADVNSETPIDQRQWRLAETAYLLRVANLRARTEGDRAGAEALLAAADELLRELDDFGLVPVRERIAEARAQLRAAPAVDRTGLYLELESLGESLGGLPLDQREYEPPAEGEDSEELFAFDTPEGAPAWTETLRERFAGLVDFRVHRPAPIRPLVAPGEAELVRHHLGLAIEQAQLALLRRDQEVWRLALEDAERWTRDYFDLEEPGVRAVLDGFERLAGEPVASEAPDISAPLEELMRLRGRAYLDPVAGTSR